MSEKENIEIIFSNIPILFELAEENIQGPININNYRLTQDELLRKIKNYKFVTEGNTKAYYGLVLLDFCKEFLKLFKNKLKAGIILDYINPVIPKLIVNSENHNSETLSKLMSN